MDKNISDWKSIYTKLLTDINWCLNIFNKLESDRIWGDWIVGDRGKINTKRLLKDTKEFKELLEKLLSICTTLSRNIEWGKKMELGYQGRLKSIFQLDYFKDESIAKHVKDLSTPTSTSKVDYSLCKEHTSYSKTGYVTGGAIAGVAGGAVAGGAAVGGFGGGSLIGLGVAGGVGGGTVIGGVVSAGTVAALAISGGIVLVPAAIGLVTSAIAAFKLAQNNIISGKERGVEYQVLKVFYDSLNNTELLANLQTHCVIMQHLSDNVAEQLKTYKLEFGTHQQAIEQKNYTIKASKLYYETLQSEIEQLRSSEPGMGEDMREKMAKRTAASSCKTFLKQSLDYSDSDAKEYIDELQS